MLLTTSARAYRESIRMEELEEASNSRPASDHLDPDYADAADLPGTALEAALNRSMDNNELLRLIAFLQYKILEELFGMRREQQARDAAGETQSERDHDRVQARDHSRSPRRRC